MPAVIVRDLPEELHGLLKEDARQHQEKISINR